MEKKESSSTRVTTNPSDIDIEMQKLLGRVDFAHPHIKLHVRTPQRDDYERLLVLREELGELCRVCDLVKNHIENQCFKNWTRSTN